MRIIDFKIDSMSDGKTVGVILKDKLCVSSRLLPELKRGGGILLDGKNVTVRERVTAGQTLTLRIAEESSSENVVPSDIPLNILFEDQDILAAAKPKDMPVHPSAHNYDNTLGNAVMNHYRGTPFVFRPITRLDRDTTGVVIIAKNKLAASILTDQMQDGKIKKVYLALLSGIPKEKKGIISAPIARCGDSVIKRCVSTSEGAKDALTEYEVISERPDGTCVASVRPITGRTHQIRVHMAHIGCPLLYDYLYGTEIAGKTLFLHCSAVEFFHPVTKEQMKIECPIFEDSELLPFLD